MSYTLAQLRSEVKLGMVNRTDVDSNIDQWLNDTQLSLASRLRIRELKTAASVALAVTDETQPLPADMWAPILLMDVTTASDPREIRLRSLEEIRKRPTTPHARPDAYTIDGSNFRFRPVSDGNYALTFDYLRKPPLMTVTQGMTLPDEFRAALVFGALSRGFHILQEEDRAQYFTKLAEEELTRVGDARGEQHYAGEGGVQLQWSGIEASRSPWRR